MSGRYPGAKWLPWRPDSPEGPTFYRGTNRPQAVVLHVMAGHAGTAREWAAAGHFGASWHYTVTRGGEVYQHLEHADGGYHAGIAGDVRPPWILWRGPAVNVNNYTIGVEHEGFPGGPFPLAQAAASRALCRWLAAELAIPLDEAHFPPHAAIDPVNRANDFNTPAERAAFYRYLFAPEEAEMGITEETAEAIAERIARRVFDETAGGYYLALTRKYWLDVAEGDFSAAPAPDVVAAIRQAVAAGGAGDLSPLVALGARAAPALRELAAALEAVRPST